MISYGFPFCRIFLYTFNKLIKKTNSNDETAVDLESSLIYLLTLVRAINIIQSDNQTKENLKSALKKIIETIMETKENIIDTPFSNELMSLVIMLLLEGEEDVIPQDVTDTLIEIVHKFLNDKEKEATEDSNRDIFLYRTIIDYITGKTAEETKELDFSSASDTTLLLFGYILTRDAQLLNLLKSRVQGLSAVDAWETIYYHFTLFPKRSNEIIQAFNNHKELENPRDFLALISWIDGFMRYGKYDLFLEPPDFDIPKIETSVDFLKDDFEDSLILARGKAVHEKYGCYGLIYIGKGLEDEIFGKKILIDAVDSHRIFICGKTGSGKSYTAGVILEELAMSGLNIGAVIFDPAGTFYDMNQKPSEEKHSSLLKKWGLPSISFTNVIVFVPTNVYQQLSEEHKRFSRPFSISPAELSIDDWCHTFGIDPIKSPQADLLSKVIRLLKRGYVTSEGVEIEPKMEFSVDDMVFCLERAAEINDSKTYKGETIKTLRRKLENTKNWHIFGAKGTPISEISVGRRISIIDLSFIESDSVKALVTGLIVRKIFETRQNMHISGKLRMSMKHKIPVTWVFIDEAHNFAAAEKITPATPHLIKYAKEGRKYGCSMVLVTQQPSATHNHILSQIDIMISHTLSNKRDTLAFKSKCPTRIPEEVDIDDALASLSTGSAIIAAERHNRIFFAQIRPRLSKHAGKTAKPEIVDEEFLFESVQKTELSDELYEEEYSEQQEDSQINEPLQDSTQITGSGDNAEITSESMSFEAETFESHENYVNAHQIESGYDTDDDDEAYLKRILEMVKADLQKENIQKAPEKSFTSDVLQLPPTKTKEENIIGIEKEKEVLKDEHQVGVEVSVDAAKQARMRKQMREHEKIGHTVSVEKRKDMDSVLSSIPLPSSINFAPDILAGYVLRLLLSQKKDEIYAGNVNQVEKVSTIVLSYFNVLVRSLLNVTRRYGFEYVTSYKLKKVTVIKLKNREKEATLWVGIILGEQGSFGVGLILASKQRDVIQLSDILSELEHEIEESESD